MSEHFNYIRGLLKDLEVSVPTHASSHTSAVAAQHQGLSTSRRPLQINEHVAQSDTSVTCKGYERFETATSPPLQATSGRSGETSPFSLMRGVTCSYENRGSEIPTVYPFNVDSSCLQSTVDASAIRSFTQQPLYSPWIPKARTEHARKDTSVEASTSCPSLYNNWPETFSLGPTLSPTSTNSPEASYWPILQNLGQSSLPDTSLMDVIPHEAPIFCHTSDL